MANTTVPIDPSGLIGIFKIDKDDLKDLKQAIGDSRKQSLADALAVFAGRAKSVVDFAENKIAQFEQGYFAAKLGGTSGRDMRALEAVAQDFGVSVEAMRNSTQALHRNVRDDPRIAALLEQLHISLSDGAGAQRNSADLMLELSDALKRMDPAQARSTGQGLGLDPGVMEALRDPGFGQRLSAQRDTQENSAVEAAGERAHQLMGTIRELSGSVNAMFAQALLTMGPKLQETLDGISAWFKENGQTAGKRLGEVGNFVLSIMSLLGPVISLITWLDGLTGGLSSQLLVLVGGFLMLGGGGVVGALMGLVSRLGGMRSIIGGLGTQLASLPGRISGFVSRAWTATSNFVGGVFGRMTSMGRTAVTQMGNMASAVWSWMGNMAARGGALVVDSVKAAGAIALQWGQSLWASAGSWIGRIVDGAKSLARGAAISPVAVGGGTGPVSPHAWGWHAEVAARRRAFRPRASGAGFQRGRRQLATASHGRRPDRTVARLPLRLRAWRSGGRRAGAGGRRRAGVGQCHHHHLRQRVGRPRRDRSGRGQSTKPGQRRPDAQPAGVL